MTRWEVALVTDLRTVEITVEQSRLRNFEKTQPGPTGPD